ncbi:MAG: hypothetical protein JWP78_938 [Mucilaginibacter sp.]|nr:hypothetical protein [Mucilaginibacter sp.]
MILQPFNKDQMTAGYGYVYKIRHLKPAGDLDLGNLGTGQMV